jgi:enhancer of polycomb-like protein
MPAPFSQYDESNDGDPYVCFRRREAKPVRKTRRTDSQSVDRLALLQAELIKAGQLAADTLARERRKLDLVLVEREAWEAKLRLIDAKRKYPAFPLKPDEEELLFRTGIGSTKKQRLTDPVQAREEKVSKTARKRESLAGRDSVSATGSPAPGEPKEKREDRPPPMEALKERMANIQMQIERDVARKREGDYQWEDQTDVAYQPLPIPAQARMFRPLLPEPSSASGSLAGGGGPSSPPTSSSARTSTTFRLRRGRGGILRVDRHVEHRPRPSHRGYRPSTRSDGGTTEALVNDLFPNSYFGHASEHPLRPVESDDDDDASDAMDGVVDLQPSLYAHRPRHTPDEIDYGRRVSERWRYDAEFGVVGAGMGMRGLEEEERVVVDEYEERCVASSCVLAS